jgi:hypothetical protein
MRGNIPPVRLRAPRQTRHQTEDRSQRGGCRMDGSQFDTLLRQMTTTRSRRGALAGLLAGSLGILGLTETDAKRHKKKPKKKKPSPPASPPPSPPAATCSDGIQNGSETGVDCGGGTCPRCPTGQGCAGRGDCASAVCTAGTCGTCTPGEFCTATQACFCVGPNNGVPSPVCVTGGAGSRPGGCEVCPPGTICAVFPINPGEVTCSTPCTAP